jgi:hypothetical protein
MKTLVLLTSALIATGAWGQTSKELDITMSIVDENDSPSVVINRIALPPASTYLAPTLVPGLPGSTASAAGDDLDSLQNTLQQTNDKILDSASEVISGSINDAISSGQIQDIPGDIIDNLPDDSLDDLLSLPDDDVPLIDDLIDDLSDLPEIDNTLDSQPLPLEGNDLNLDTVPADGDLLDNIPQSLTP